MNAEDLDGLAKRYGLRLVLQFGSTVLGNVHSRSDTDLAVLLDGRMIDVNDHLITDAGHAPPRDYYDSVTPLAKLRVLPPAFASQIAACAGLRNRLVHEYDEIDPRRVYEGLQVAVRDIPEYLRRVNEHLERAP